MRKKGPLDVSTSVACDLRSDDDEGDVLGEAVGGKRLEFGVELDICRVSSAQRGVTLVEVVDLVEGQVDGPPHLLVRLPAVLVC